MTIVFNQVRMHWKLLKDLNFPTSEIVPLFILAENLLYDERVIRNYISDKINKTETPSDSSFSSRTVLDPILHCFPGTLVLSSKDVCISLEISLAAEATEFANARKWFIATAATKNCRFSNYACLEVCFGYML